LTPVIAGVKYAELIGTPGGAAIPGATIRWTIIYKNTTSQTATDVRVTDVLNPQLRNPVIVSVSPASFTANPSYTGEGINTQLINPGTLAPGEKLTIVLESVVRATATGPQLTNQAVLSAAELGGPGGITVPTSAVDNTTPVCPQAVACRPDSSVVVPTSAIPNQNTVVGAPTGVPFTLAGSISGRVWNETNGDRQFNPGEQGLQGFRVAVFAINPVLPAGPDRRLSEITNPNNRPTTDANGLYTVSGLPPTNAGLSYEVVFFNENGDAILGVPRGNNANTAINGTPTLARDALTNVRVLPAQETTLQDLPLDPSGVVYDSSTRQPIAGATVQLVRVVGGVATPVPNGDLVGGSNSVVTGPSGLYQFILQPGAPAGEYRLQVTTAPAGYNTLSTNIPPSPGPVVPGGAALCPGQVAGQTCPVQAQSTPPLAGNPTTYYLSFTLTPGTSPDVIHNHIPLDSSTASGLSISKLANKSTAEIGDNVKYTIEVRNNAGGALPFVRIEDALPAGFRLIAGSVFVAAPSTTPWVALPVANIAGAPGSKITYTIIVPGNLAVGQKLTLEYRVRVGVGSLQGDGINRARAFTPSGQGSNLAQAKVKVVGGVFTSDACLAGKVFMDCNSNQVQDAEEIGVPGVRLYLQDGTYLVSDSEGKYSICGLEPKSHVLKVDQLTLPRGSRLTTTSNRNLGNADSLWLDLKNGEMQQADFAIGSCSNTVLEQVKARRAQGGVRSIDNERKGGTSLKFEGKNANYPDQGTDGSNQPLVQPRPPGAPPPQSDAENNTPVPQLPAASSNTPGNNIRLNK
ncbi:MAG: DUF11 domain-containing protein, partial [Brachymonas sp.]|nr:DUF11 domain-containing protein [Brachymonas sp.]